MSNSPLNNIYRNYLPIFFLFVNFFSLYSQNEGYTELKKLTLQEAISIASDSSLSAFKAKNLYLSGYWQYRTYMAGRLPGISLNTTPISYSNNFVERYDYTNNRDVYKSQQNLYSEATLSVSQNVDWTGGTFYIDTELGYLKNFGVSQYEQFTSVPFLIGYSQSLFGYNSFKWEKKIEPLKYEKVKKEFLNNLEEISEETTGYFFNVALNETLYKLAKQNVENSDTLYRVGEVRYNIGSISESDLLTLKLNVINAQTGLGNAALNLQKSRYSLITFLHLKNDAEFDLLVSDHVPNLIIYPEEAVMIAKQNNPVYLEQKENILSANQNLDQTIKSTRFSANLSASVGYNQVAYNLRGAYNSPLRQDVVSIGFTVPLVDWGVGKGKVNIARRKLEAAKITEQQTEQTFEQNVISAVKEFNLRQSQIKLAKEAKDIANQALTKAKQLFYIGKADVNTVNSSVSKQIEAESNYINALSNYWSSYYTVRKLTLYDFETHKNITTQFEEINGF